MHYLKKVICSAVVTRVVNKHVLCNIIVHTAYTLESKKNVTTNIAAIKAPKGRSTIHHVK